MHVPAQITFRGLPHSDAVGSAIHERVDGLSRFYSKIVYCHVLVESEHRHRHQGYRYHVTVELAVPQTRLVISHSHHDRQAHQDVYAAIRDAFDATTRRLEDLARRQRGEMKGDRLPGGKRVALTGPGGG